MDIKTARQLAIKYGLKAPAWALDESIPIQDIIDRIGSDGGCGPGKWGDKLIPDAILGLSLTPCCYCHDCSYSEADTADKKYQADIDLFANSNKLNNKESNWIMHFPRARLIWWYYYCVDRAGGSFTAGK
jgi:hypothetical protein